ncbi:MAG: MFS transporter [Sporolactobacillus sp.]
MTDVNLDKKESKARTVHAYHLMQNKDFLLLISAQAISNFGDGVYMLGLLWAVKLLTASGTSMSFVLIAETLPTVFLGIIAGVFIDRGRKKFFMIVSDLVRAFIIVCVAVLWQFHLMSIWIFICSAFIMACFSTFFSPARAVALRTVVAEEDYQKAMSISQTIQTIISLIAPAISGILIAINVELTFYFDGMTFLISFALICCLHNKSLTVTSTGTQSFLSIKSSLKEGFQAVLTISLLRNMILFMLFLNIILSPIEVLVPLYANNVTYMAIFESVFTFGMLLGAIIAGFMGKVKRVISLCTGLFLIMISFGGLFVVHSPILAGCLFLGAGVGAPITNITMSTIFTLNVPRHVLGRASSIVQVIITGANPLALAVTGVLLVHFTIRDMFLFISLLGLLVVILMIWNKSVRTA